MISSHVGVCIRTVYTQYQRTEDRFVIETESHGRECSANALNRGERKDILFGCNKKPSSDFGGMKKGNMAIRVAITRGSGPSKDGKRGR